MDDLRPARPLPPTGVRRFTPEEKNFSERPRDKKAERAPQAVEEKAEIPPVDTGEGDSDHQLDERA